MAINWTSWANQGLEELEGSPTSDYSRKTGSAEMSVRCPESKVDAFLAELLPASYMQGVQVVIPEAATFPGKPWLVAKSVKISPHFDNTIEHHPTSFPARYPHHKITISFGTEEFDQSSNPLSSGAGGGSPLGGTGPGGSNGSTGGKNPPLHGGGTGNQASQQASTLISHKVTIGGEFLSIPSGGLSWALPLDMSLFRCDPNKAVTQRQVQATSDVNAGVVIPTIEHHITWHFVAFPPWAAMRKLIGTVNAYNFAGAPPECLLFMGAEASAEVTTQGGRTWTMSYKFSEKNNNQLDPKNPFGWNHFMRPGGSLAGTWQRLLRKLPGGSTTLKEELRDSMIQNDLVVMNSSGFPYCGTFTVMIDSEIIKIEEITGSNDWQILERGVNDTTVAHHNKGATVTQIYSSKLAAAMNEGQHTAYINFDWDFPISGSQFYIQIDGEVMAVSVVSSYVSTINTYTGLTVLRGVNGTEPASHGSGSEVRIVPGPVYPSSDFRYLFLSGLVMG